jgi:hypothetical protein
MSEIQPIVNDRSIDKIFLLFIYIEKVEIDNILLDHMCFTSTSFSGTIYITQYKQKKLSLLYKHLKFPL